MDTLQSRRAVIKDKEVDEDDDNSSSDSWSSDADKTVSATPAPADPLGEWRSLVASWTAISQGLRDKFGSATVLISGETDRLLVICKLISYSSSSEA